MIALHWLNGLILTFGFITCVGPSVVDDVYDLHLTRVAFCSDGEQELIGYVNRRGELAGGDQAGVCKVQWDASGNATFQRIQFPSAYYWSTAGSQFCAITNWNRGQQETRLLMLNPGDQPSDPNMVRSYPASLIACRAIADQSLILVTTDQIIHVKLEDLQN